MYNFHKIRENNSESYFHHECFDRDDKYFLTYFSEMPCPKSRENLKKRKEKIKTVTMNTMKTNPFPLGTEEVKTKTTGNTTIIKSFLKRESPSTY